jgi:hypothetical protein
MSDTLQRRFRESATRLPEPVTLVTGSQPTEGQQDLFGAHVGREPAEGGAIRNGEIGFVGSTEGRAIVHSDGTVDFKPKGGPLMLGIDPRTFHPYYARNH